MEPARKLRIRSPNYPAISLVEAVERLQKMYPKVHTHKVDKATMVQAGGYTGLNGAALSMLSAMKKYGLLEDVGDDVKVSQNALTIIADPIVSESRKAAIQTAAFSPPLFSEIRKEFPDSIPSDEVVRSYLLKKSFAAANVDIVIRAFRETMKLVTAEGVGYTEIDVDPVEPFADTLVRELREPPPRPLPPSGQVIAKPAMTPASGQVEVGAYPVAKNCMVRLMATGPLTQKAVEALIRQLQIGVELGLYPDDEQEAG